MGKIDQDIFVIIPGYNEEKYLATVLKKVRIITQQIIYVDDGSQDRSVAIANRLCQHVLRHRVNLGKGAALKTGCEYAFKHLGAKKVIFFDSDDQHDANELKHFFEALKDHEVVFGERGFDHNMPALRIFTNRLLSFIVYLLFGRYVADIPSGFKALSKKAYQRIKWKSTDYAVELEIAARVAKLRIPYQTIKISTIYHDFDRGMTLLDGLRTVLYLINLRISI